MNWHDWVFLAGLVVLVALPPKYDPAIRWKERQERKRATRDKESQP